METFSHLKTESETGRQAQPADETAYREFIEIALHDLDAPFRKFGVLLDMLSTKFEKVREDPDIQVYIKRVEDNVYQIRTLIDDLSQLAAIHPGKIKYISCNMETILRSVINELPADKQSRVHYSSLPVIEVDAKLMTILFKNILDNAFKFHKEDQLPEIEIVSSLLNNEEKDRLGMGHKGVCHKIEISDRGIGFDNRDAGNIFRPFVRLNGKSQFAGNGIGLAICHKIAEIHEGIIFAEGNEQEGAKFTLLLPEIH